MRILLCLLVLLSLADVGLLLDLRQHLTSRERAADSATPAAPAAKTTETESRVDPALVERLLKDWPWRPDGTMPPR